MSNLAKKLSLRIEKELGIKVEPKIYRTRAGYWQKAQGAWSWFMETKDNFEVGSQHSAKDVLNAKVWGSDNVYPMQTHIMI